MKKGKGVIIGVVLVFIIVVSVISVNAGFLDFIFGEKTGDQEGELAAERGAKASVEVTGVSTPPRIVHVSDVNETSNNLNPYGFQQKNLEFNFVVCSDGGPSELPPNGGTVMASFNNSANSPSVVNHVSCVKIGDLGLGAYGCSGIIPVNYSCTVGLILYYYEPGLWTINATVQDRSSNWGINNTHSFVLTTLQSWEMAPNYVNWTSISMPVAAPGIESDNDLKINLTGNYDIDDAAAPSRPLAVNATNLTGQTQPTFIITGSDFAAREGVSGCIAGRTQLDQHDFVDIIPFNIDHATSTQTIPASEYIGFCLTPVSGLPAQEYVSSQDWVIRAF